MVLMCEWRITTCRSNPCSSTHATMSQRRPRMIISGEDTGTLRPLDMVTVNGIKGTAFTKSRNGDSSINDPVGFSEGARGSAYPRASSLYTPDGIKATQGFLDRGLPLRGAPSRI